MSYILFKYDVGAILAKCVTNLLRSAAILDPGRPGCVSQKTFTASSALSRNRKKIKKRATPPGFQFSRDSIRANIDRQRA